MPYIPEPEIRTAVFQGEISSSLVLTESAIVGNVYGQDTSYGNIASGILISFAPNGMFPFNANTRGARGADNGLPTSLNGTYIQFHTSTHVNEVNHIGDDDPFIIAPTGIWDNTFYITYLYSNNDEDFFTSHGFWDVTLDTDFDPGLGVLVNTTFAGAFPAPLVGEGRFDGALMGSRRAKSINGDNLRLINPYWSEKDLAGPGPWTTHTYYFCFEAGSVELKNGYSLSFDTASDYSNSRSIDTTDQSFNYSINLNNQYSSRVLVKWEETAFSWEGATSQEVFTPAFSDPADQLAWESFGYGNFPGGDDYWGFILACKNGFIISHTNWNTGYYRFYLVTAAWDKYWRIDWTDIPPAYDGIACMMLDDNGYFNVIDDYYDVYFGLGFIPPAPSIAPVYNQRPFTMGLPPQLFLMPLQIAFSGTKKGK